MRMSLPGESSADRLLVQAGKNAFENSSPYRVGRHDSNPYAAQNLKKYSDSRNSLPVILSRFAEESHDPRN